MTPVQLPEVPAHISTDGHELWDWAASFSSAIQREAARRELRSRIAAIGTKCGDCYKWMKRSDCPREKGVMTGGPSSGAPKCSVFVESPSYTRLREQLSAELAALNPSETNSER